MKRAIGLAWLTVSELTSHEQVTVAAQAGYSHVGLRLLPVANQLLPPFDERETGWRLRDTGLKVLDVEVFRLAPQTRVSDFESTLAAAGRLGARQLLVHGDDPDEQRLVDAFGRLCDLAAPYGLAANLEPMPWVQVSTVTRAKRILEGSRRTNAGLLVDPIHFFRADNRLDELQEVRTNYLQLCDAPAERPGDMQEIIRQARSDRLFPGEGELDLENLLRVLPAGLPISVEVPYAKPMSALERAKRALAATQKLLLPRVA
jgi:sugar phosphate isomerase/epimerase